MLPEKALLEVKKRGKIINFSPVWRIGVTLL